MENFEARLRARLEELTEAEKQEQEKIATCDKQIEAWARDRAIYIGNAQALAGGRLEVEKMLALMQDPQPKEPCEDRASLLPDEVLHALAVDNAALGGRPKPQ